MNREIERKFLLTEDWKENILLDLDGYIEIKQGYIKYENPVVRVRASKDSRLPYLTGNITIKGNPVEGELGVDEYEYDILGADAEKMISDYCLSIVEKIRYRVKYDGKLWEIDEFYGANSGLAFCEVELESENEKLKLPPFVAMEVTGDEKYYNNYISKNPYSTWDV